MNISDFIPVGRSNAILMKTLSERKGIKPRECRRWVQREREQGAPICSDWEHDGYYLPLNVSEALIYLRQQNARIKSARAALRGVKKYIKENKGE